MQLPFARRGSYRAAAPKKEESAWSSARFILMLVILAWALRSFVFQPFYIPSVSMLPTLYIGDYLIIAKWPYGYDRYSFPFAQPAISGRILGGTPSRGDVVVFRHPTEDADLIKRVIGLPGDTIEVKGGELILNGKAVPREELAPYRLPISANTPCRVVPPGVQLISGRDCLYPAYRETLPGGPSYTVLDQIEGPGDDFGPVKVPAGHVFVMGDNRDDSLDSRFPTSEGGVGMLPMGNLVGRATVTFWSTDGSASYWKPWTWFTALRGDRLGNTYTGDAK